MCTYVGNYEIVRTNYLILDNIRIKTVVCTQKGFSYVLI